MTAAPTLTTRRARPDDAARLGTVHVRGWQQGYVGLLPVEVLARLDPITRADWWARLLADQAGVPEDEPGRVTHVAERDGEVVGFVGTGPVRGDHTEPDLTAELFLYVHPDAWRGGVGRALMDTALDRLVRAGYADAMLWVLDGNDRAIAFYEATGWRPDGARRVEKIWGATTAELAYRRRLTP